MTLPWQTSDTNSTDAIAPALHTVLVCDVVESVRWMQANEAGAVAQWQAFAEAVKTRVLPLYGGRIVKSLGDGLMLDFAQAPAANAINAAFAIHNIASQTINTPATAKFNLRIGVHHTPVTIGDGDIYGNGVNLAARIATLAGPGEVIITAEMRDQLTDQLDADIEDMGECYLKHLDEPVRVYRAGPAGAQPIITPLREYSTPMQATIAVIPFAARSLAADNQLAVGEIIADGVIGQLSRTRDLKVISRLSTSVFRSRFHVKSNTGGSNGLNNDVSSIESHLGANYVISGSYIALDKKLIVTAELADTKTNQVVWMDRLQADVMDILQLQSELCHTIANAAHQAILETEVQAALTKPLPTLESYSLLLGAVTMLHRTSRNEFARALALLELLAERHSDQAELQSWIAKWHVLNVEQGWSVDKQKSSLNALAHSQRAVHINSNSSLALAINGFVLCNLHQDFDKAQAIYQEALLINPNESIASLLLGMLHAFKGESAAAIQAIEKATSLSPLDPAKYFYDSLTASVHLTAGNYEQSIEFAKRSLRGNATHVSTHRAMTIAQVMAGHMSDAQLSAEKLMKLDPSLTVSRYLARSPGVRFGIGKTFADALRQAGVPA